MPDREHINGPRFTIPAGISVVITPNHKPGSAYTHQITKPIYFRSKAGRAPPEYFVFVTKGWTIRVEEKDVITRPVIESLAFDLEGGQKIVANIDHYGMCREVLPFHDGPAKAGTTMLDVTAGGQLWVDGKVCRVATVYVHRSSPPSDASEPVSSGHAFLAAAAATRQ
jgi:hypothetical protein